MKWLASALVGLVTFGGTTACTTFNPKVEGLSCTDNNECPPALACDPIELRCRQPSDDDAAPDAGGSDGMRAVFCEPSISGLIVCHRFEGDLLDESGYGNTPIVGHDVFDVGVDGLAVRTLSVTEIPVVDNASFDVATLTMEVWLRPDELPAVGKRAGIYDVNGQYMFYIGADGEFVCLAGVDRMVRVTGAVSVDIWTHLACTYDGTAMIAYVDGAAAAIVPATGKPNVNSGDSVALAGNAPTGHPFIGLMDSFRLWSTARSEAEICAGAGICTLYSKNQSK